MSMDIASQEAIRTEAHPVCSLCGSGGTLLYDGLRDTVFGVAGVWPMRRCSRCGLLWLDPRPASSEVAKIYQNYHTHTVAATGRQRFTWLRHAVLQQAWADRYGYPTPPLTAGRRRLARLARLLPGVADGAILEVMGLDRRWGSQLLDVGCGSGRFMDQMRSLGWTTAGVEVDAVAATYARDTFGLDVREGTLLDAGYAGASFDVVTLSHVIEHVDDPVELLRECLRVLRPGGRIVITTPNSASLGHRLFGAAWRGLEPPRHLAIFARCNLEDCAARAGFMRETSTTSGRLAREIYTASIMSRAALRGAPQPHYDARHIKFQRYLFQFAEELARLLVRDVGEELFYIGVKPT